DDKVYRGIYSTAESYAKVFGEYTRAPAESSGADYVDDGATWDPEILKNMKHPDFAKHKARFEAWQDSRADRDFDDEY
ncbi:MAG TPA: hypothetical protein VNF99_09955, partial [Stellaceae bacterium]|nr:hypothetical protein [Stellaceae bacterium]